MKIIPENYIKSFYENADVKLIKEITICNLFAAKLKLKLRQASDLIEKMKSGSTNIFNEDFSDEDKVKVEFIFKSKKLDKISLFLDSVKEVLGKLLEENSGFEGYRLKKYKGKMNLQGLEFVRISQLKRLFKIIGAELIEI